MRKCVLGFLLVGFSNCLIAQVVRTPVTTVYTHLNTYSSSNADVFSFTGNQAALAAIKNFSAGVYGERRFLLEELSQYSAAVALPTSSGNFGLAANYFGGQSHNESEIGLAYARKLSDKVDVGVQFNYNTFKVAGYGNASVINFDAGVIFHITDQLSTGVHVYNPTGVKIDKDENEKLPAIYSMGLGYDASENFFIGAEVEKVEDQPVNVNAGMQYKFDEKIFARLGIHSATSVYYFGFGIQLKDIRIDATASIHPYLGVTPGLLLIYSAQH